MREHFVKLGETAIIWPEPDTIRMQPRALRLLGEPYHDMRPWPVARMSIFDAHAPLADAMLCERSERADNKLDKVNQMLLQAALLWPEPNSRAQRA